MRLRVQIVRMVERRQVEDACHSFFSCFVYQRRRIVLAGSEQTGVYVFAIVYR